MTTNDDDNGDQMDEADERQPFEPILTDREWGDPNHSDSPLPIFDHLDSLGELDDQEFGVVRDAVLDEVRRRTGREHLTTTELFNELYGEEDLDEWLENAPDEPHPNTDIDRDQENADH